MGAMRNSLMSIANSPDDGQGDYAPIDGEAWQVPCPRCSSPTGRTIFDGEMRAIVCDGCGFSTKRRYRWKDAVKEWEGERVDTHNFENGSPSEIEPAAKKDADTEVTEVVADGEMLKLKDRVEKKSWEVLDHYFDGTEKPEKAKIALGVIACRVKERSLRLR